MGKIAESTDLGIFDVKVQDNFDLRTCSNKIFSKFIYSDSEESKNHLNALF